ncbi:Helix-turn-helix domain-containing protein [Amycolatopsis xylanica]|uniref:Helix-turn-helix domain-containing protein n=1 Tax=Amycolatopsis xylanica TaxID=589385 RepID=A0A1H3HFZ9_9PSEU|nr:helix-turn-helix domain-containing protein [Amycolatopsis xylanica]SDY13748.1 Helix-turn-helix domain-containing protein [Amycolatopsis xylanica]
MAEPRRADLAALKALANPLRQRILDQLKAGPATSTTLAAQLGVTSGGTSYNLRVLAENGFVEEIEGKGHGRERWWRVLEHDLRLPKPAEHDPSDAMRDLHRLWLQGDTDLYDRFQSERASLGEWADAVPYSRGSIRVTLDELGDFFEEYLALLRRYQRPESETPPGARSVETRCLAFPTPRPKED